MEITKETQLYVVINNDHCSDGTPLFYADGAFLTEEHAKARCVELNKKFWDELMDDCDDEEEASEYYDEAILAKVCKIKIKDIE